MRTNMGPSQSPDPDHCDGLDQGEIKGLESVTRAGACVPVKKSPGRWQPGLKHRYGPRVDKPTLADHTPITFEAKLAKIVTGEPKAKGRIKNC